MNERPGQWIALFSGGKDSAWALHRAQVAGLSVGRLVTMHAGQDAVLFHVPGTDRIETIAAPIDIPVTRARLETERPSQQSNVSAAGDREAAQLAAVIDRLDDDLPGGVAGLISGAVASTFQHDRLTALADRHDIAHFSPLWGANPELAAQRLIETGFEVRIVAVAADGLDRAWLGRRFDGEALADLVELHDRTGVHPLGEGGEFETLVLDGPHMKAALSVEATRRWDGVRGHLEIRNIEVADAPELRLTDRS